MRKDKERGSERERETAAASVCFTRWDSERARERGEEGVRAREKVSETEVEDRKAERD